MWSVYPLQKSAACSAPLVLQKLQQNHTRRCKHASDENDEEYIRRALQLGANEIRGYKEKAEYMKKLNELEV